MKLGTRITLTTTCLVAVAVGVYGYVSVRIRRSELQADLERETQSIGAALQVALEAALQEGLYEDVRTLVQRLQAAEQQISQAGKDRDAALAKVQEIQATLNYRQSQLDDERKATAEAEEKLASLRSTFAALRERLWAAGQADWVVRVEAEAFAGLKDVQVKPSASAGGGKALLFDKPTSAVETVIAVKPGTYVVVPVGMAPDGGDHDALDLTVKALDRMRWPVRLAWNWSARVASAAPGTASR